MTETTMLGMGLGLPYPAYAAWLVGVYAAHPNGWTMLDSLGAVQREAVRAQHVECVCDVTALVGPHCQLCPTEQGYPCYTLRLLDAANRGDQDDDRDDA